MYGIQAAKRLASISGILPTPSSRFLHICSSWYGRIVQFNLSDIGEGIAEVEVKEWHVKAGDRVSQFDNLCEVQSDKASVTITSRYDGVIKKLHYDINEIARVGKPLIDIELHEEEESSSSDDDRAEVLEPQAAVAASDGISERESPQTASKKALAAPAVRRLAMENKLDIRTVAGSGRDGRVLKEDVLSYLATTAQTYAAPRSGDPRSGPSPGVSPPAAAEAGRFDETSPLRGYARAMLKTMTAANAIPHFGYCDEICMDRLVELREQLKSMATERGVKMSYMPLFIKAASLALLEFPVLNSSLDDQLENLTYKAAHNICVAMDTKDGLVVPNIKHCEQKNLWDIGADLSRLHAAGLSGRLAPDDLSDGTFTLSNIGSIGGTYAHPVIFPPQVAIGALGRMQVKPRFDQRGELARTHLVNVSWAADHRIVDGATMARFSNLWKRYLENPALMIADMK